MHLHAGLTPVHPLREPQLPDPLRPRPGPQGPAQDIPHRPLHPARRTAALLPASPARLPAHPGLRPAAIRLHVADILPAAILRRPEAPARPIPAAATAVAAAIPAAAAATAVAADTPAATVPAHPAVAHPTAAGISARTPPAYLS